LRVEGLCEGNGLIGRAAPKAFGVGSRFKSWPGYHFSFFDQSNHPSI
jgi:hypothetical protein